MRKLSAIMLALLLVSGVAMASDVAISGNVDWTHLVSSGPDFTGEFESDFKVTAMVDDYNTAVVKLELEKLTTAGVSLSEDDLAQDLNGDGDQEDTLSATDSSGVFDEAYFDTDWAGFFGLDQMAPVGLTSRVGYWEYSDQDAGEVTNLGIEDAEEWLKDAYKEDWAYQVVISAVDMVHLQATIDPGPPQEGTSAPNALLGVYGGGEFPFGAINAELFFYDTDDSADLEEGGVLFGASWEGAVVPDMVTLAVGLEFVYDLDAAEYAYDGDTDLTDDYAYGVGVSASYMDMATMGIGFLGTTEAPAGGLGLDLGIYPIDLVGFDFAVGMVLDDALTKVKDQETLDMFEGSVVLNIGAADFRVGYLYDGTDEEDDANSSNLDANYKSEDGLDGQNSSGAVFIRTTLGY